MSIVQMGLAWHSAIPTTAKIVLLELADHAEDDGTRAHPSVELIGLKTGLDRRTVQRTLRKLEDDQIIEPVDFVAGGRGHATDYELHIDRAPQTPHHFPKGRQKCALCGLRKGGTESLKGGTESLKGGTPPPEPSENHQKEPPRTIPAHARARTEGALALAEPLVSLTPETDTEERPTAAYVEHPHLPLLWQMICTELRNHVSPGAMEWPRAARLVMTEDGDFAVLCPTEANAEQIGLRFAKRITAEVRKFARDPDVQLSICLDPAKAAAG